MNSQNLFPNGSVTNESESYSQLGSSTSAATGITIYGSNTPAGVSLAFALTNHGSYPRIAHSSSIKPHQHPSRILGYNYIITHLLRITRRNLQLTCKILSQAPNTRLVEAFPQGAGWIDHDGLRVVVVVSPCGFYQNSQFGKFSVDTPLALGSFMLG